MSTTDYIGYPEYTTHYWTNVADLMFAIAEVDDAIDQQHNATAECDHRCIDLHDERRELVHKIIDLGLTVHDINLQVALIRHWNSKAYETDPRHHNCTECGQEL